MKPAEIGMLATFGIGRVYIYSLFITSSKINVARKPKIAIISTGNELATADNNSRPGLIFDSNRPMLMAAINDCGGIVVDIGIVPDKQKTLEDTLLLALKSADIVLSTGGVR